jgi:large subunit ribosomal protein L21
MYAVIEHGSHQFRVAEGDKITIDSHKAVDEGGEIVFDNVLLIAGPDGVSIGTPKLDAARVTGELVRHFRGKKILVRKFKRRKGFRKRRGHRSHYSTVLIKQILPVA